MKNKNVITFIVLISIIVSVQSLLVYKVVNALGIMELEGINGFTLNENPQGIQANFVDIFTNNSSDKVLTTNKKIDLTNFSATFKINSRTDAAWISPQFTNYKSSFQVNVPSGIKGILPLYNLNWWSATDIAIQMHLQSSTNDFNTLVNCLPGAVNNYDNNIIVPNAQTSHSLVKIELKKNGSKYGYYVNENLSYEFDSAAIETIFGGTTGYFMILANGGVDISVININGLVPTDYTPDVIFYSYTVSGGNIITGLSEGQNSVNFKKGITIQNNTLVKLLDQNDIELNETAYFGTGCSMQVTNEEEITNYKGLLKGDISGDGIINSADLAATKSDLLNIQKLTDLLKDASDINDDGNISINDILAIKKHLLGITPITPISGTPISKIVQASDGKSYLEVDNKPFLLNGVQLRTDLWLKSVMTSFTPPSTRVYSNKPLSWIDNMFEKASSLNFKTVVVPIGWVDIETNEGGQGSRDWTVLNQMLVSATSRGLKMELIWFDTNFCGVAYDNYVPTYITRNPATYPQISNNHTDEFRGLYGKTFTMDYSADYNNPAHPLLNAETSVITDTMNYISSWEESHGNPHTIIAVRIGSEPGYYVYNTTLNASVYGKQALWYVDMLGRAIKNSNYPVITTASVPGEGMSQYLVDGITKQLFGLSGIDVVCIDPYVTHTYTTPASSTSRNDQGISNIITNYMNDVVSPYKSYKNMGYVGENFGSVTNSNSLMLSAFDAGGNYSAYDLAAPQNAEESPGDSGLCVAFDSNLTNKSYTAGVGEFELAINKISMDIASAPKANFAGFNISTDNPSTSKTETKTIGGISITYITTVGGLGGAVEKNGVVTMFSYKAGKFKIGSITGTPLASIGYYDSNYNWVQTSTRTLTNNTGGFWTVTLSSTEAAKVIRTN